jgi:hypothetical protein
MAAMLTLEAIGPKGEELADQAGDALDIPVGFDPEFECATFDATDLGEPELETAVFDALEALDPEWRTHLRVAE